MPKPSFDSAFYRLLFVMLAMVLMTQACAALVLWWFYSAAAFKAPPGMSVPLQLFLAVLIQLVPLLISSWIGARMLAGSPAAPATDCQGGAALDRHRSRPPHRDRGRPQAA